jgi:hypothetical protein
MRHLASVLLLAAAAAPLAGHGAARIYAQELVDRAAARHPQAVVLALHVTPPKTSTNVIIAAKGDSVGKPSSAADLQVIRSGKPRFGLDKTGNRFDAELVLRDVGLRPVGALEVGFDYKKGEDQAALRKQAEAIGEELRRRIAHAGNLMDTYPVDASIPTHTVAQHLVDQALDEDPGIIIIAIHVPTPTNKDYPIIASNIGRIGKKADADDMEVITTAKPRLEINESGDRFESEGPLRDSAGHVIGAAGVVFPYKEGDDKQALHAKAVALRDAWAKQTPDAASLLRPYP